MTHNKKFYLEEKVGLSNSIQYTIFHVIYNKSGGSVSTPIGRIEILNRPSSEGVHPHKELRIIMRNDVRIRWGVVRITKSPRKLTKSNQIIPESELKNIIQKLIEVENINEPYNVYRCVENVEDYRVFGELYKFD